VNTNIGPTVVSLHSFMVSDHRRETCMENAYIKCIGLGASFVRTVYNIDSLQNAEICMLLFS